MSYLYSEHSFGSQSIFSSSVGKAAILSLHHGIAASQEQTAVKKLKRRACSSRLAGVNADVVEHVPIERTESSREFHSGSLIENLLETHDVHGGREQSRHFHRHVGVPKERPRRIIVLVGVLIAVGFGKAVGFANIFRLIGRRNVYGSVRGRWRLRDQTAGRRNSAAAAGRIDENTDVRAGDALDDAFTDVCRAFLRVPEIVKARNAIGKKAQVSRQKPKTDFPCFFPSSVAILHGNDLLLMIIRERPAYGLQRRPQHEPQQRERRGDYEQDEEEDGAEDDLKRVEVALHLAPPHALQTGGDAAGEKTVQEPETREDQTPSYGMETFQEEIGERRRS